MPQYRVARALFNADFAKGLAERNESITSVSVAFDPELVGDGNGVPISMIKARTTVDDIAGAYLVDTVVMDPRPEIPGERVRYRP